MVRLGNRKGEKERHERRSRNGVELAREAGHLVCCSVFPLSSAFGEPEAMKWRHDLRVKPANSTANEFAP
jgi:hypothetical protein